MTVKSDDEPHLAYVNGAGLALREMEFQRNVLYINTDEKRIQYWNGSSLVEFIIQKYEDFMGTKGMTDGLAPLNSLKQIPSEYLPEFLRQIAPYALRAKSTAAYTVKAIKKELEVKAGIRFVKPTKTK